MRKIPQIKIILIIAVFTVLSIGCSSNLTAETSGQVTNSVIDRDVKTSKKKTSSNKTKKTTKVEIETEIDYTYTVDGKNYTGFIEKDGNVISSFAIGSTVVVCYNPKNPEESDVFAVGTKCGN
jgi:heat shock protein HslJ